MKFLILAFTTAIFVIALISQSQGDDVNTTSADNNAPSGRFFGSYSFGGGRYGHNQGGRPRGGRGKGLLRKLLGLDALQELQPPAADCTCPLVVKFVCGANNKTYENECELKCEGIEKAHDGSCEDPDQDCDCPLIVKHVCGSNNETYENECELKCDGVEKAHDGECEGGSSTTEIPKPSE